MRKNKEITTLAKNKKKANLKTKNYNLLNGIQPSLAKINKDSTEDSNSAPRLQESELPF